MVPCVLKEAVHGIEHLVGEIEEPLPGRSTVVQPFLPLEDDVQPSSEVLRLESHYLRGGGGLGKEGGGEGRRGGEKGKGGEGDFLLLVVLLLTNLCK